MKNKASVTPFAPYETKNPNGRETGYFRVTPSLYKSDAVRDLTDLAYRIFLDMKFIAKGHPEVKYTQAQCRDGYIASSGGYTDSIKQLVSVGLIERKPRGNWAPSTFKFSTNWRKYISPNRDALTGKYYKIKIKRQSSV